MPEGRQIPPSAPVAPGVYMEDYDSDQSVAIPESRVDARNSTPAKKPLLHPHPHGKQTRRDAASDSGYSSHNSNVASSGYSQPNATTQPAKQAPKPDAPKAGKPTVHQDSRPQISRTNSISRAQSCGDAQCTDPDCGKRYTLPDRSRPSQQPPLQSQPTQYPVQNPMQGHQPFYQYHQPQARPRASSRAARPTSWYDPSYAGANGYPPYGGAPPQGTYIPPQHQGPAHSPSGYNNKSYMDYYMSNVARQGMSGQMTSGSPRDSFGTHLPQHSGYDTANSSHYPPTLPPSSSARHITPALPGQDVVDTKSARQQTSKPTLSARRRSIMPGSFPGEGALFNDSGSGSGSDSYSSGSDSEDERLRRRKEQPRRRSDHRRADERERARRDLEAMPPPSRRPDYKRSNKTMPADARHPSRERSRNARYAERDTPSDYVNPDRRSRNGVERRSTYDSQPVGRDRQRSISRSPPASRRISIGSRQVQQYIVEDPQGNKTFYDTREAAQHAAHRLEQLAAQRLEQQAVQRFEKQREEAAEAYQAKQRGAPQAPALTAENVKRQTTRQPERKAPSHVSGASSKKSSSTRMSRSESTIQIQRGDTTFNIPVNSTIEVRQTEEGETWVIGSGSPPREKSYYPGSSKSSGSHVGRSRNGSNYGRDGRDHGRARRDTFTGEDGYESAL